MGDLYGAAIGLLLLAGTLIAAYFRGSKSAEDKAELKAALKDKAAMAVEIDRNAKHKKIDESVSTIDDDDVNAGLRFIFGKGKRG